MDDITVIRVAGVAADGRIWLRWMLGNWLAKIGFLGR